MKQGKASRGFAAISIILGVLVLAFGLLQVMRASSSRNWVMTEGVVEASEVVTRNSKSTPRGANRGSTYYTPSVMYRYTVAGEEYTGSRISFGEYSSNRDYAQFFVERYPTGKVTVFYNPDNPQEAVLEKGITDGVWFLPVLGAGMIGIGILCHRAFGREVSSLPFI